MSLQDKDAQWAMHCSPLNKMKEINQAFLLLSCRLKVMGLGTGPSQHGWWCCSSHPGRVNSGVSLLQLLQSSLHFPDSSLLKNWIKRSLAACIMPTMLPEPAPSGAHEEHIWPDSPAIQLFLHCSPSDKEQESFFRIFSWPISLTRSTINRARQDN